MSGLLIVILISWVLLKLFKKNLEVLGLFPTEKRNIQFLAGFLLAAFFSGIYFYSLVEILGARVEVNGTFDLSDFFYGAWWTMRSVLWEELLFRGALLYIAIDLLGKRKALWLSAIVFGVYHWFSYNIFGNPVPMIYVFILTGVSGYMFAYAYVKTRSLYLPIALHFGWNLMSIVIFSEGPLGEQLIITHTENTLEGIWSLYSFLYQILVLPFITLISLKKIPSLRSLKLKTSS